MEPIFKGVTNVLDVIEEAGRIKMIGLCNTAIADRLKHQLYIDTLKAIARRSSDEHSRDMAIEALWLEENGATNVQKKT